VLASVGQLGSSIEYLRNSNSYALQIFGSVKYGDKNRKLTSWLPLGNSNSIIEWLANDKNGDPYSHPTNSHNYHSDAV